MGKDKASLDASVNPALKYGVHPKPLMPNRVDLYVPAGKKMMVKMIQEALARDGSSLSAFVMELLEKWWEKHAPGNPQTGLERYAENAPVLPGPDVPGSINYLNRKGEEHWGWLMDLPDRGVIFVRGDGKKEFLQLRLAG